MSESLWLSYMSLLTTCSCQLQNSSIFTSVFCERPHTSSLVQDPSAFLICIFIMKSCVSNIIFFKSCAALCLQTWALAFLFWCIFFILRGIILFLSCAALCLRTCAHLHSSSDIINKWWLIILCAHLHSPSDYIFIFISCAALCLRTCAHLHSSSDIINKWW